jgi:hypothetical protein
MGDGDVRLAARRRGMPDSLPFESILWSRVSAGWLAAAPVATTGGTSRALPNSGLLYRTVKGGRYLVSFF